MIHWSEVSARWHENYERGRPSYPREVVRVAGLPRSAAVLELGPGTGKLTRLLISEFERVIGIEPDPGMRRLCAATCPQANLVGGKAEEVPLGDASVDGVFVAEAFHWFAHERALVDIARVLRPCGVLLLLWNRPAGPIEPPIPGVEKLLEPLWPKDTEMPLDLNPTRFAHARDWPDAFQHSAFEPLREAHFANPLTLDRDGLLAFFGSMGWIDALPDEALAVFLDEVRSGLQARTYQLVFETDVYWTRLAD